MSEFVHVSVLRDELVDAVLASGGTRFVDLTAGGGGHCEALLRRAPGAELMAFDRDAVAIAACRERLAPFGDRVALVNSPFDRFSSALGQHWGDGPDDATVQVDGVMADLGVSSPQIDHAERGFSWSAEGPLDMRMGDDAQTVLELMVERSPEELAAMFRDGEVTGAGRIARAISNDARAGLLKTTLDLAGLCERVLGRTRSHHPATLVFQALRMEVNDELGQVKRVLEQIRHAIRPGGMVAVITFHSLEDRIVKQLFRGWSQPPVMPRGVPVRNAAVVDWCKPSKPVSASEAEVAENPRSRSARLRVIQKKGGPVSGRGER
jgi:16S rRNA (cytosine1402-N4)-methyltransferase